MSEIKTNQENVVADSISNEILEKVSEKIFNQLSSYGETINEEQLDEIISSIELTIAKIGDFLFSLAIELDGSEEQELASAIVERLGNYFYMLGDSIFNPNEETTEQPDAPKA